MFLRNKVLKMKALMEVKGKERRKVKRVRRNLILQRSLKKMKRMQRNLRNQRN